jgi:site-specific recombinase XerC
MVRPSAASLNSLAEILRKAQSLYSECHSIISDLGHEEVSQTKVYASASESYQYLVSVNKKAHPIP